MVDDVTWVDQNLLLEYGEIDPGSCPSLGALAQLQFAKTAGCETDWRKMYDVRRMPARADKCVDDWDSGLEGAIDRLKLDGRG